MTGVNRRQIGLVRFLVADGPRWSKRRIDVCWRFVARSAIFP